MDLLRRDPYEILFGRSNDMLAGKAGKCASTADESISAKQKRSETSSPPPHPSVLRGNGSRNDYIMEEDNHTAHKSVFPEPSYKDRIVRDDYSSAVVSPSDSRRPCEGTVLHKTKPGPGSSLWDNGQMGEQESESIADYKTSPKASAITSTDNTQSGQYAEKDWRQTDLERKRSDSIHPVPKPSLKNDQDDGYGTSPIPKPVKSTRTHDFPSIEASNITLDNLYRVPPTASQVRWGVASGIWPETEWNINGFKKEIHEPAFKTGTFPVPIQDNEKQRKIGSSHIDGVHPVSLPENEIRKDDRTGIWPAPDQSFNGFEDSVDVHTSSREQKASHRLPKDDLDHLTASHIRESMGGKARLKEEQAKSKLRDKLEKEFASIHERESVVAMEPTRSFDNPAPESLPASTETQPAASTNSRTYTTLVYDRDTDTMYSTTSAGTYSVEELSSSPTIPIHEALSMLHFPSKFMSHLPEQFDVTRAAGDLLLIRESDGMGSKIKTTQISSEPEPKDEEWTRINPVDGTTRLSPTGFVGVDDFREDIRKEMIESRRQEEKERYKEKEPAGEKKTAKERKPGGTASVFKTAIVATAICYVAGVGGEVARRGP